MNKFLTTIVIATLTFCVVGCGKTENKKQQEQANAEMKPGAPGLWPPAQMRPTNEHHF